MFLARLLAIAAFLLISVPASAAPDHVVADQEILETLSDPASSPELEREALLHLLDDPRTREVAEAHDIDIEQARDAAATMTDAEVQALSPYVAQLDGSMAGGDRIVIGASTIIIILLVLILIAVA